MKKLNKNNKGFSLVELLVVIAIMVVLVGVIAPTLLSNIEKARVSSDIQSLDSVASALQDALGTEKAYTYCMTNLVNTPAAVSTVIGTSRTTNDFSDVANEYLATVPGMKGSIAKRTSDPYTMYYMIDSNGRVAVWLGSATFSPADPPVLPTETTLGDNVCKSKDGTAYIVTR